MSVNAVEAAGASTMMASKFGSMGKVAVIYNSVVDSFMRGMASRGEVSSRPRPLPT